ncbi:aspartyl/asparaginyl beta-hydroxylase-like isoform X8 [Ciona intestinalis]
MQGTSDARQTMESQDELHGGVVRQRGNVMGKNIQEQNNGSNETTPEPNKELSPTSSKGSSVVLILLLLMVGITWGIAATAYFGVVDYKVLVGIKETEKVVTERGEPPVMSQDNQPSKEGETTNENMKTADKDERDNTLKQTEGKVKVKDTAQDPTKSKNSTPKKTKKPTTKTTDGTVPKKKKNPPDPLTSEKDIPILKQLREAEKLLKSKQAAKAKAAYQKLVSSNPESPMARFGKAESLFQQAEQERSNKLLQECIQAYNEVAELATCPPALKKKALLTKAERQTFLGHLRAALLTKTQLARDFPNDEKVLNQLGVAYLMIGQNDKAKQVFETVLDIHPGDGFALVHLGFIIKIKGDWMKSIEYLLPGVTSLEEGTQEGKFYFHLGDALYRTNRTKEADEIYKLGAERGLFRSKFQRSLYNVERLQSRPFWTPQQAKVVDYVKKLEKNWKTIRDEALKMMDVKKGLFVNEDENLRNTGEWRQFTLYQRGKKDAACSRVPKTCSILEQMPNAVGCTRGQVKYSIMMPGTHIWPHTGPTNCRLRMHLGLVIPTTGDGVRLRCADDIRTWEEGKVLIFDDSFEHEVWQQADTFRLILIVDVWHPDITKREKRTLTPI